MGSFEGRPTALSRNWAPRPNHALDRTPESMAALRGRSLGGAGQGER
jgi:hypothetical protein